MWNDNETDVDLLGFDDLVDQLIDLVQQGALLPLTIGVFGDWGSGKSSLMGMARGKLAAHERIVTVSFSPWQHEDYDDVKTALILTVMAELRSRTPLLEKAKASGKAEVARLFERLRRRVGVLRTVAWAAKGVSAALLAAQGDAGAAATLALSSAADAAKTLTPDKVLSEVAKVADAAAEAGDAPINEPVEQSVGQFRREFGALLQALDIDALVVFIDDLDRCLPETIVDTLEAMRLFLAVPKTAFVIGADERIVQHAIGRRYPELPAQGLDIGREYLEKMIQIPLRIPPMSAAETETYLNLLGAQRYLDETAGRKAREAARDNRLKHIGLPFNYGVAQTALGTVPKELAEHLALVARVAPVLASGLNGNPRQAKRFLNTLVQRQRLAARRGITLEAPVLAKLMVLEYLHLAQFKDLFRWQGEAAPKPAPQLAELERVLTGAKTSLSADLQRWLDEPALHRWLEQHPPLATVDLQPYFHFSRDRLSATAGPTRRLRQELQELIVKLRGASDTEHGLAEAAILRLDDADLRLVFSELTAAFVADPRADNAKLGLRLLSLAQANRALVSMLAGALGQANTQAVQPALALAMRVPFKGAGDPLPPELRAVLQRWAGEGPTKLSKAATTALG